MAKDYYPAIEVSERPCMASALRIDLFENAPAAMSNSFKIKQIGIVIEIVDSSSFKVEIEDGSIINATISGKMKMNLEPDICLGEKLPIVISPIERTRGRIDLRHWKRSKSEE